MGEEQGSSASRPSWWKNLVSHRWGHEAPTPDCSGPAGLYVRGQVEQRLQSPEWNNTEARSHRADDAAEPVMRAPRNRPAFPPDGSGVPPANRRPYPA
jgi:hypothetical protein